MAVVQIPNLPPAISLNGDEPVEIVQAGQSKRVGVQAIANLGVTISSTQVLSDISVLRTVFVVNDTTVFVEGYYSVGDGGGGYFYGVSGSPAGTYVDNGGTIILPTGGDGSSAWLRIVDGMYNVKWFGAKGDLSINDAVPIQKCVDAAAGHTIYAPVGQYRFDNSVTSTLPLNIVGDGNGAGPGSAAQSNDNVTQFLMNYANPTAFSVSSVYPSTFRNFQINVWPTYRPAGNGAGINLTGVGTANTAGSIIDNVSFNWLFIGVKFNQVAYCRVTNCYFGDWTYSAIYSDTSSTTEASTGFISHNFFFGSTNGSQSACIYLKNGYTIIAENEILGAQAGIRVNIANYPAGFIRIINNTIEEQYLFGVYVDNIEDANDASMLDISGNEFSAIDSTTYLSSIFIGDTPNSIWLTDVSITNNTMRNFRSVGLGYIRLGAGKNVIIQGNLFECIAGTTTLGIGVEGVSNNNCLASPISVLDNSFIGTFTKQYEFHAVDGVGVLLRDQIPRTYAQIPGNCRDGSLIYVSDGKSAGLTYTAADQFVTSGGTGCVAIRTRGFWLTTGPFS